MEPNARQGLDEIDLDDVIAEGAIGRLSSAVESTPQWTEHHAQMVDHTHQALVLQAIRRPDATHDLNELADHLRAAVPFPVRAELETLGGFVTRWHAWADLCHHRLQELDSRDQQSVLRRKNVPGILNALANGPVRQSVLRESLGLKPANLSRVLGLMERNELVTRFKRDNGRENWVRSLSTEMPAPNPLPAAPQPAANPKAATRQPAELDPPPSPTTSNASNRNLLLALRDGASSQSYEDRRKYSQILPPAKPEQYSAIFAAIFARGVAQSHIELHAEEEIRALASDPAFWANGVSDFSELGAEPDTHVMVVVRLPLLYRQLRRDHSQAPKGEPLSPLYSHFGVDSQAATPPTLATHS